MPRIIINASGEQLSEPSLFQQPREIIEYRWDRICGAALLLAGLVAVLVWMGISLGGSENLMDQSQPTPEPAMHSQLPTQDYSQTAPVASPVPDKAETVPAPSTAQHERAVQPSTNQQSAAVSDRNASPAGSLARVRILSPHIKQAQLTTDVVNSQPVDQLPATVAMNEQGLLRIYLYTQTTGLGERKLYHDWLLDGKRMARVQLPARQRLVTVSSSKFIDRHMTGNWTVNIRDDRNQLLAEADFSVVR